MEYKNISKKDLVLIGFGLVKAGGIIKTKNKINNFNFEIVEKIIEETQKEEDKLKNKNV